jgi:hypothetical protein
MDTRFNQIACGAMAAAITLTAFAPAAFAGHGGKSQKYRGGYAREVGYSQPYVAEHHSSSAGPAIAGFNDGQAAYGYEGGYGGQSRTRVSVHASYGDNCGNQASYYYEDPWNGRRYDDLSAYRNQCNGHWPIARVVDARSGGCVQYVCWHDGGWYNYDASDPPWCNQGGYRSGDRGGYDRGGYDQGSYDQGGYDQGGYGRDRHDRGN